jgi:hypothetical protein
MMQYIKINNDMWADVGKIWFVHEYTIRENTTAVTLTIEDTKTGEVETRVVPHNQIEWLEAKDW